MLDNGDDDDDNDTVTTLTVMMITTTTTAIMTLIGAVIDILQPTASLAKWLRRPSSERETRVRFPLSSWGFFRVESFQ